MRKKIEMENKKFGKLLVIKEGGRNADGRVLWLCLCDCGKTKEISGKYLRTGHTTSCGCNNNYDLTGRRFGRLVVVKFNGRNHFSKLWNCVCDCGSSRPIPAFYLLNGHTTSCGCLRNEVISKTKKDLTGKVFGRLTALERFKDKWLCLCECGKETKVYTKHLTSGETISCGCYRREQSIKRLYNPLLTDEHRKHHRLYIGYSRWRQKVFERDNYLCQICYRNYKLRAHHLESYHANKELRTVVENGVTLCLDCHIAFHKKYGTRNNTKEQFQEFIKIPRG